MDRDDFLFALKERYAEEIYEAYLECEHDDGKVIDFNQLNSMLAKLQRSAIVEGLTPEDFDELLRAELPDIHNKVQLGDKAA